MFLHFLLALLALNILIILHELSHFFVAKKFGVKVEELGIGLPPRIFGRKIGETIYSLNLLPFGAFVRLPGEIKREQDIGGFSSLPMRKRMLIVLAGVLSFWLFTMIIFSFLFGLGIRMVVQEGQENLIEPRVQVIAISPASPAAEAKILPEDTILEFKTHQETVKIEKVGQFQNLSEKYKGEKVSLMIERKGEIINLELIPRVSPPPGEGPMGLALATTAIVKYPWYLAPIKGILTTFKITFLIIQGYGEAITNLVNSQPSGVKLIGPVGVVHFLSEASRSGFIYFLQFLGLISLYLAIFNALPIPAFDGGKILFLTIEAIRKKPVNPKLEERITTLFFLLLIMLAIFVTINDIKELF